jgi:putative oxidoreductase
MDVGLLILRVVVGSLFIGHGTQKLFGWFGGHGPEGTGQFFQSTGFRPGRPMAYLAGMSEAGGGLFLLLGLLTPLAAAAIIGIMVSAALAVHAKNGMWNTKGGMEFPIVNMAVAATLAFAGPGRFSLDHAIGWGLDGTGWGLLSIAVGFLAALIVLSRRAAQLRSDSVGRDGDRTHRAA